MYTAYCIHYTSYYIRHTWQIMNTCSYFIFSLCSAATVGDNPKILWDCRRLAANVWNRESGIPWYTRYLWMQFYQQVCCTTIVIMVHSYIMSYAAKFANAHVANPCFSVTPEDRTEEFLPRDPNSNWSEPTKQCMTGLLATCYLHGANKIMNNG